ncbi:hypothetical protein Sango_0357900 [Sesamum angolense]|uniref:Uncharacterized protein n=1 Tax=Sesamum angolense TaxID=2727404 RepID=A0AAE1X9G4_9LAMI|nr:hypothetical protein Sango_0357900 [Sesamum angolense]
MPLTPHLQRLYTSKAITEQLTWHTNHQIKEGSICHPSDAEAYKHFDRTYPDFTTEPRNVRLVYLPNGDPCPFESVTSHRYLTGAADRGVLEFTACGCADARQCKGRDIHDTRLVDVDGYGSEHKLAKKNIFWE